MRHMAVYHQFDMNAQRSTWIILQPPTIIKDRLSAALNASYQENTERLANTFIELHLFCFVSTERRWREYLKDLEAELNKLVSLVY